MAIKAINSMFWYSFDIFLNRGSYFLVTLYLAKIMGPTEFGLASILGIIYYLGLAISDSGMSNSLMRSLVCDDEDYGTVLATNLIFGIFVYILLYISAPLVSSFLNVPRISSLLPVYALGVILSSCKSVYIAYLMKTFQYKLMFLLNIPGNIISIILAIYLSLKGFGIWSIIYLFLSSQLVSLLMFYLFSGWKTKFYFNIEKFKSHFNFGYKLSISSLINTFFENIYQILIGKYFSLRLAGIFDRSFALGNYPISILSTVISKVTLPLFVNFSSDLKLFKDKFQEVIKLTSFLTCFVAGLLMIIIPFIIINFMGAEWIQSVPIFKILLYGLLLYPIHAINLNILNVFGRSDIFLILEIIKKCIQTITVIFCYRLGLNGLVIGFVCLSIGSLILNLYYTQFFIKYSIVRQILDVLPNIFVSWLSFIGSNYFFNSLGGNLFLLFIQILIFITIFISLSIFFNKVAITYVQNIIFTLIKNNNKTC
jgi:O-antigen/teichoic acid export membrane protein